MTTTIKVTAHNHPALVETIDQQDRAEQDRAATHLARVLRPSDGEQTFHCTTTTAIRIVDLEYGDPRAAFSYDGSGLRAPSQVLGAHK